MTDRDFGRELDELKEQVARLNELLGDRKERVRSRSGEPSDEWVGDVRKMRNMSDDPNVMALLDRLENDCGTSGDSGRIAYMGVFTSAGLQSTWIQPDVSANELLDLISSHEAEKMIASVGSGAALSLLLSLLRRPKTVAELVEDCGFSSSGGAYYHLNTLIDAGIIVQSDMRGEYKIDPSRVQGVIMLLAGVKDLMNK